MKHYSQVFKPTEVLMMMSAFSNTETIHIAAYCHLLDTIGMPEIEYTAFLKYKEMKDKYDYMQTFSVENKTEIAKTLAAFGAFTEGLQLFASFAILMNFPRFNKMKGMGQIVSWSVRDETLHCLSVIRLFRTFVQENPEIWTEELKRDLYLICATIVDHEDAFIDLAFELGGVRGPRWRADQGVHPLHRRPPPAAARPRAALPHREEPAALARRDAERGRAHQLLREPRDRILRARAPPAAGRRPSPTTTFSLAAAGRRPHRSSAGARLRTILTHGGGAQGPPLRARVLARCRPGAAI